MKKKIHEGGNGYFVLCIHHLWKKKRKKMLMKKLCIKKGMWKREWMMNGENEMKWKEKRDEKGIMWCEEKRELVDEDRSEKKLYSTSQMILH